MKTLFTVFLAVLMVISFSMTGFANMQKAATGSQATATEKKMEPMEKAMIFTGKVTTVNEADKTIIVKGKEGEQTFDVSQATMKGKIEPEHYVAVKYMERNGKMVASSVRTVSQKVSSSNMKSHKVASNMSSINWKQLDRVANAEYAGIGEATRCQTC